MQVALRARRDQPFAALAFSGDGTVLASANGNNDAVTLWDVPTGKVKTTIKTNADNVRAVALTADGTLLAAGGGRPPAVAGVKERGTLRLWDVATGKERAAFKGHSDYPVQFVAFSADGKRLASADEHDTAKVWDVATGKALTTIKVGPITGAAFSRDGKHLAVAVALDDVLLLYDAPGGK